MTKRISQSSQLRSMLDSANTILIPIGALPVHAQMAQAAGFSAFQLSNELIARFYGLPGAGLLTETEVTELIRATVPLVQIPLYCDAGTGFGSPMNVRRTIEDFILSGAAGAHLGDLAGSGYARLDDDTHLLADDEIVGRLRAAVDMRDELDPEFVISARTHAATAIDSGFDEAVRRANLYLERANVDLVHVEGLKDWDDAARMLAAIDGPAAVSVTGVRQGTPSPMRLAEIGQRLQRVDFTLPGIQEVWDLLLATRDAAESAPIDSYREHLFSLRGTERYVGYGDRFARPSYAEARVWEDKYLPDSMRPAYSLETAYTG